MLFKKRKKEMNMYSEEEIKKYQEFIVSQFGKIDGVIHEIVSDDVNIDILVISPTSEDNYYKLITMGMGAYQMNVPRKLRNYELDRAELVVYLPATWNIESKKEEDYWPIRNMKTIARLPKNSNSWIGYSHTISNDSVNSPYASNTKFCSTLLLPALDKEFNVLDFKLDENKRINFYQLFPLYLEELNFIYENDMPSLLQLLEDTLNPPIIDINRRNAILDKD